MAPQGHAVGAGGRGGACDNSSLERQGCSPFYQDVTEDPYVDQVSSHPAVLLLFQPSDILNYCKMLE